MADWESIAGKNNWSGLLDPVLDSDLRQRIVDCGERVRVIYDSIDKDRNSSNYGLPKYSKEDLFSYLGPDKGKMDKSTHVYEVKKYIYAFADVHSSVDWIVEDRSVWMGYVAVATNKGKEDLGRRDILICWRGTLMGAERLKIAQASQVPCGRIFKNSNGRANVHKGFFSLYTASANSAPNNRDSARKQVLDAVTELVNQYKEEQISITVTGHSLGAALATLNAADIVANDRNKVKNAETKKVEKEFMVTAFVFASPKIGNEGFKEFINGLANLSLLHIYHFFDVIPQFPIHFRRFRYYKTGFKKVIYSIDSDFLNILFRPLQMKTYFHSLENLLQLLNDQGRSARRVDQGNYALVEGENGAWKVIEVPATSGA